jgi:hypothetical protein
MKNKMAMRAFIWPTIDGLDWNLMAYRGIIGPTTVAAQLSRAVLLFRALALRRPVRRRRPE